MSNSTLVERSAGNVSLKKKHLFLYHNSPGRNVWETTPHKNSTSELIHAGRKKCGKCFTLKKNGSASEFCHVGKQNVWEVFHMEKKKI